MSLTADERTPGNNGFQGFPQRVQRALIDLARVMAMIMASGAFGDKPYKLYFDSQVGGEHTESDTDEDSQSVSDGNTLDRDFKDKEEEKGEEEAENEEEGEENEEEEGNEEEEEETEEEVDGVDVPDASPIQSERADVVIEYSRLEDHEDDAHASLRLHGINMPSGDDCLRIDLDSGFKQVGKMRDYDDEEIPDYCSLKVDIMTAYWRRCFTGRLKATMSLPLTAQVYDCARDKPDCKIATLQFLPPAPQIFPLCRAGVLGGKRYLQWLKK